MKTNDSDEEVVDKYDRFEEEEHVTSRIGRRDIIKNRVIQAKTDTRETVARRDEKRAKVSVLKSTAQLEKALKIAEDERKAAKQRADDILRPLQQPTVLKRDKTESVKLGLPITRIEEYWNRVADNPTGNRDKILADFKKEIAVDIADKNMHICQICTREKSAFEMGRAACQHLICKTCKSFLDKKCPLCNGVIRTEDELKLLQVELLESRNPKEKGRIYDKIRRAIGTISMSKIMNEKDENKDKDTAEAVVVGKNFKKGENFYTHAKISKNIEDQEKAMRKQVVLAVREHNVEAIKTRDVEVKPNDAEIDEIINQLSVIPVEEVKNAVGILLGDDKERKEELQRKLYREKQALRRQKGRVSRRLAEQEKMEKCKRKEQKDLKIGLQKRRMYLEMLKTAKIENDDEGEVLDLGTDVVGVLKTKDGKRKRYTREFVRKANRMTQHNKGRLDLTTIIEEEEVEDSVQKVKIGPTIKHKGSMDVELHGIHFQIYQCALAIVQGNKALCFNVENGKIDVPHEYASSDDTLDLVVGRFHSTYGDFNVTSMEVKKKTLWVYAMKMDLVNYLTCDLSQMRGEVCTGLMYDLRKKIEGIPAPPPTSAKKLAKKMVYTTRGTLPDSQMTCPLTMSRVNHPVLCSCTPPHRFERWALESFIAQHKVCPRSGLKMSNIDIRPDPAGEEDLVKRRATKDKILSATALEQLRLDNLQQFGENMIEYIEEEEGQAPKRNYYEGRRKFLHPGENWQNMP